MRQDTDLAWDRFLLRHHRTRAWNPRPTVCLTRGGAACVVPDTTTLSALTVTDAERQLELTFHQDV